ncbi:hypothetical protein [Clostridium perfringens]|uniref:hypothetical protein n=1 Tax=Clostridium perfringens TaxID=1502 RepID=UPI002246DC37|nr:hypothetical protein [Clostridium perfringens]EJT5920841.1 hypothetical protein [Clostridium perfringens]MCX0403346.1 hypothetical protein [Clostridium perfringens]MDM0947485.1 hypothetical protein [Clostridium perfringens]
MDNNLKNDAQLAGRLPKEYKDFIDSLWKDADGNKLPGEDFPSAIKKLIDAYNARPVEAEELDFSTELKQIKGALATVEEIITGIKGRATQRIVEITTNVNNKLEQKNAVLKENEANLITLEKNIEEKFNLFLKENNSLKEALYERDKEITDLTKQILNLKAENSNKDVVIQQLNIEKAKLNAEVLEHIELSKEQQTKINSLLALGEENKDLKNKLQDLNEDNRNLKVEFNAKESENTNLKNKLNETEQRLLVREEEIMNLKNEYRDTVSNLTLEHKESIIAIKEKVKEEVKEKFEKKIDGYKDEIFNLKKEIEFLKKDK